jgi:ferredoxin-NADP reductase/Na+-translocating ferredoxin:NAD+ oxidoreductase RnfD subunit
MYAPIITLFQKIEKRLDAIAMYRIVSVSLLFIAFFAALFGFFGIIPYTGTEQVISLVIALVVALVTNWLCSKIWRISVNHESAFITALILFFLIIPAQLSDIGSSWVIALVTFVAILSKFVFAWRKQHIANPAAIGVVLVALAYSVFPIPGYFESTWWIGRIELFVPLLIAGVAVVTKIRKWTPVLSFLAVAFVVYLFEEWRFGADVMSRAGSFWFAGPGLFLAFFMLTEPFTMPPTKKLQLVYGAFVGFISQTTLFLPFLKMTPEFALVVGNLVMYPSTLKRKLILPLVSSVEVAKNTYEFAFAKPAGLKFEAGQYLEWMLPHTKSDNRGIRRYFTISSGPSDTLLRVAVRFADTVSTYKSVMRDMKVGDTIIASQLAGDFVLPKDLEQKVALIAGGIGVTPFLSQIDEMVTQKSVRSTVLFYCNNTVEEIAYKDKLAAAAEVIPLTVVNVLAKEEVPGYETGYVTKELIKKYVPDYVSVKWYLSGPPGMVNAYSALLREVGVPEKNIKRDFFPGLA